MIIQSSGFRDTVKEIAQKEGILGFYKGITPFLIGNYISYGIYFFWYYVFY